MRDGNPRRIKRILHVIDGLGNGGGAERQLALNLKYFDRYKFDHLVAHVWGHKTALKSEIESFNVPVHSLNIRHQNDWIRGTQRLVNLIRRERIDVVATSLSQADMLGGLAGRITCRPVVGTLVNTSYGPEWLVDNRHLSRWKLRAMRVIRSQVLRHLHTRLIAISNGAQDSAIRYLRVPARKITVVHRSLGPEWLTAGTDVPTSDEIKLDSLRESLSLDSASPLIVSVGRLVPQKGHRYLIEATAKLVDELPDIRVIIAGELTSHRELAGIRDRLGLQSHVQFLGSRTDILDLYRLADIAVFASLYEGFGNALAEACATGKPCVATRISGFNDIVRHRDTALVVDPRSSEQLADAIRILTRNRTEARAMGERAREDVVERFDVERTVGRFEDVYESVLTGRNVA